MPENWLAVEEKGNTAAFSGVARNIQSQPIGTRCSDGTGFVQGRAARSKAYRETARDGTFAEALPRNESVGHMASLFPRIGQNLQTRSPFSAEVLSAGIVIDWLL
jgi:hypothetical protein